LNVHAIPQWLEVAPGPAAGHTWPLGQDAVLVHVSETQLPPWHIWSTGQLVVVVHPLIAVTVTSPA
jgi:hypothetical protein